MGSEVRFQATTSRRVTSQDLFFTDQGHWLLIPAFLLLVLVKIEGIFGYIKGCSKHKRLEENRTGWQQEVPMQKKTLSVFTKNVNSKAIQRFNRVKLLQKPHILEQRELLKCLHE